MKIQTFILFLILFVFNPPAIAAIWNIQTVDSAGIVGANTSIALNSDGLPCIAYYDVTNGTIKYAEWKHYTYPYSFYAWDKKVVDSFLTTGGATDISLAIDHADVPHISYYDPYDKVLRYAKWNTSTASWNLQTVDSIIRVGKYNSIAVDSSNYPHISYYDEAHGDLKYAKWTGSTWAKETVDSNPEGYSGVGMYTSIALDSNNVPYISYYDGSAPNLDLKLAKTMPLPLTGGYFWYKEVVDSSYDTGPYTSIALDSNYRPHISFYSKSSGRLVYAKWEGFWTIRAVDLYHDVAWTSIALDSNNNAHISYYDITHEDLKYARYIDYEDKWGPQSGTGWKIENGWFIQTIDSTGIVGKWPSIALDDKNLPHISYYDETNGNLKYATIP